MNPEYVIRHLHLTQIIVTFIIVKQVLVPCSIYFHHIVAIVCELVIVSIYFNCQSICTNKQVCSIGVKISAIRRVLAHVSWKIKRSLISHFTFILSVTFNRIKWASFRVAESCLGRFLKMTEFGVGR